jgi:hypothetical protein
MDFIFQKTHGILLKHNITLQNQSAAMALKPDKQNVNEREINMSTIYDVVIVGEVQPWQRHTCVTRQACHIVLESGKVVQALPIPIPRANWFMPPNPKTPLNRSWWMNYGHPTNR